MKKRTKIIIYCICLFITILAVMDDPDFLDPIGIIALFITAGILYFIITIPVRIYHFFVKDEKQEVIERRIVEERIIEVPVEKKQEKHGLCICKNCGAAISINEPFCEYCKSRNEEFEK